MREGGKRGGKAGRRRAEGRGRARGLRGGKGRGKERGARKEKGEKRIFICVFQENPSISENYI